ncbi:MAG: transcription elongation factor GreA [Candidatus Wildermuthbacteria bacterium]|nr:transcription elongation factor GreA [Candidatus Wildermuthbacteria bacterium]
MANYITEEGVKKIKEELDYLKNTKRKEITERIRVAVAHGDLSENFEYAAAREEQEMVELRIRELEEVLLNSTKVSTSVSGDTVQIGSHILLEVDSKKVEYIITGPQETDPLNGKISAESPLGRALLGRRKGDTASLETPGGKTIYKILEIA